MAEAIALYSGYVVASALLPRLPRAARVLDFGDRDGLVGPHLEAAGHAVTREERATKHFAGAFAAVGSWASVRPVAQGLADLLEPDAPLLLWMARGPSEGEIALDFGPGFSWQHAGVIGLLVPGRERSSWAEAHPHAFAALCAAEGLVRRSRFFRPGGREVLLLGTRRAA